MGKKSELRGRFWQKRKITRKLRGRMKRSIPGWYTFEKTQMWPLSRVMFSRALARQFSQKKSVWYVKQIRMNSCRRERKLRANRTRNVKVINDWMRHRRLRVATVRRGVRFIRALARHCSQQTSTWYTVQIRAISSRRGRKLRANRTRNGKSY